MTEAKSTPENPWPVRTVARKLLDWINRLGDVWVEGQVTQLNARSSTAFLTLRDPSVDMSMSITCNAGMIRELQLTEGSRVIVHGKISFYPNRGTLSLRADEIRAVGIGELLARIERLRKLLHAEGLFDPRRKRRRGRTLPGASSHGSLSPYSAASMAMRPPRSSSAAFWRRLALTRSSRRFSTS